MKVLYEHIPTYDKYKSKVWSNSMYSDYVTLGCKFSEIKKILPLESLVVKEQGYSYHDVSFDGNEFKMIIKNPVNNTLMLFIEEYFKLNYNNKLYFYNTFKETLELLLKLIKEKVHYHNSDEVVELIKGLMVNLPENAHNRESKNLEHDVLKEKLKFELEFLNRLNNK